MNTLESLREFIATVDLPPNLRLEADDDGHGVFLGIEMVWPNLNDPTETVTTYRQHRLQSVQLYPEVKRAVVEMLVTSSWMHELHEWFKIGGEYVQVPHPELVSR